MEKISTLFRKDPNDLGRVIHETNPENEWVFNGYGIATRKYDGTACAVIDDELYKRYDAKLLKGRKLKALNYYVDALSIDMTVSKVSNKPFEDGKLTSIIKEFSSHPITNEKSAILRCGSNIDLRQLKPTSNIPSKYYKTIPDGSIACQKPDTITGHQPYWAPCDRDNPADKWHWIAYDTYTDFNAKTAEDGTYELCGPKIQGNPEGLDHHELIPHGLTRCTIPYKTWDGIKTYLELHDIEGIVFHHITDGRMCKIRKSDFGIKR